MRLISALKVEQDLQRVRREEMEKRSETNISKQFGAKRIPFKAHFVTISQFELGIFKNHEDITVAIQDKLLKYFTLHHFLNKREKSDCDRAQSQVKPF